MSLLVAMFAPTFAAKMSRVSPIHSLFFETSNAPKAMPLAGHTNDTFAKTGTRPVPKVAARK